MRTKKTMKLMSWNVNASKIKQINKNKGKLDNRVEAIANVKADIVTLQEVSNEVASYFKEKFPEIGLKYVVTNYDLPDVPNLKTGPSKNGKAVDGELIASLWPLETIPGFFRKIPWQKSVLSAIITSEEYGEIEIHTVHVPNASSSGRWEEGPSGDWSSEKGTTATKLRGRQIKVDTFKGIYAALSKLAASNRHRILCGDFNSPKKEEHRDGNVSNVTYFGDNDNHRRSEEQVLSGLAEYDLADAYPNKTFEYSFVYKDGTQRRLDHIFSSGSLNPKECRYLHYFRESGLSDHSPVYAVYEPTIKKKIAISPVGRTTLR